MLGFLADQFLTTSGVREDITNEGALAGEDHCRVCFRVVSTLYFIRQVILGRFEIIPIFVKSSRLFRL